MSAETPYGVAFPGHFPPRSCGIATFTQDLRHAVAERDETVCRGAADFHPMPTHADLLCVQHVCGIFR